MADSNILREFLVKIGYAVDKPSQQKADSSIKNTTLVVRNLGFAVAAAGAAVAAGTAKISGDLNRLGYIAERTHSTVSGIRGIGYAAEQLGSSSEEARAAIEGLSQKLREQPGRESQLHRLGIETRDANGELRGSVDLLEDLGKRLANMKEATAQAYGKDLGIPQKLLLAMQDDRFGAYLDEYKNRSKGLGLDDAADKAQELGRQLNQVKTQFEDIGLAATANLQEALSPMLDRLSDWAKNEGPGIADNIGVQTEQIIGYVSQLMTWYDKADATVRKWSDSFNDAQKTRQDNSLMHWSGNQTWMQSEIGDNSWMGFGEFLARSIATGNGKTGTWYNPFSYLPETVRDEAEGSVRQDEAVGRKSRREKVLELLTKDGWSPMHASGIAAGLQLESGYGKDARGDKDKNGQYQALGVAQWQGPRRGDYIEWAKNQRDEGVNRGINVGHASLEDQVAFLTYEMTQGKEKRAGDLVRATINANRAGYVFRHDYERPSDLEGDSKKTGALAQKIFSETHINVHGVENPREVARQVQDAQDRQHHQTARNFAAAVR